MQVLALLFMARADVGYTVRQAAVHVWKTIVTNTPRTTGEILKTLMDQIITSLGHESTFTAPLLPDCDSKWLSLYLAVLDLAATCPSLLDSSVAAVLRYCCCVCTSQMACH